MSRPPPGAPSNGYRNMSSNSNPNGPPVPTHASASAPYSQSRVASMSRAERFEDEKRRIIESAFSKLDQNGQLAESYITHIRVQEDAQYPSSPPPPESSQETKKPRLIIIAVRSTGRVRMHKARENNNGSFSIGKTWNLEELSAIETYSGCPEAPKSEKEAQHRLWAGSVGFTVSITKPYYWQAGTSKEKDFFIASTVKIYAKYTKGQVPELRGFDENHKAQMLGSLSAQQPPHPASSGSRPRNASDSPTPPQPPFAQRKHSREDSRYRESPGPPGSMSDRQRGSSRYESPGGAPYGPPPALLPGVSKPFASTDNLRSQSRERSVPRPGTAPGPGGPRSPQLDFSQMPRSPGMQPSSPQLGADGFGNLPGSSSQGALPRTQFGRSASPRNMKPGYQQSMNTVSEDHARNQSSPPTNGASPGKMFQAAQQRWQDQQQQPLSPQPSPRLPQAPAAQSQQPPPVDRALKTAESNVSTPDADPGFAAAFASVPGFAGSEHAAAQPLSPTQAPEPSSPPTPERSRKRPPLESTLSDSNINRKPAPLALKNTPLPNQSHDPGSKDATSNEMPQPEEPPSVNSLYGMKNKSDTHLSTPGGLEKSALGRSPLATPAETPSAEPTSPQEEYRPGLGPMIKKKVVADRFKKAANAASAFKPRPGGAAEKILKAKADREAGEPDGITGVVPRPPKLETKQEQPAAPQQDDLAVKEPTKEPPSQPPAVEVSSPMSPARDVDQQNLGGMDGTKGVQLEDAPQRLSTPDAQTRKEEEERERIEQRQVRQPQVKVKRRSAQQEQYLTELGIDRSLLTDKCLDFEMMLHDYGWNDTSLSTKALADMEASLRREQARLEAGSWLSSPSQETSLREEREKQVSNLLDRAIQECDEMDGLLTIYNVELSSLNDDISYIEAQSQGLQVQAANQRTLHTELTNLVETLTLDRKVFEPLRHADLSDARNLEMAEQSLVRLYEALVKIDPKIRSSGRPKSRSGVNEGNELSSMAAVKKKREQYTQESDRFCQRVMSHLDSAFGNSISSVKGKALQPVPGNAGMMKLDGDAFNEARRGLWIYSPLVLFTKELNLPAWQTMLRMYYSRAKPLYADAFGQNVAYWKRCLRKPTGEEAELLFTAQEREDAASSSALSSARKLTVKRSQTLAKTLRSASGEKTSPVDSRNTGSMSHCEVFSGAVDEMAVLLSFEQNFVVDFFHATSLETSDFMDFVAKTPPQERYGTNLAQQKPLDPDREMARQVTSVMNEIFGFFTNELSSLVDWSVVSDPIQGVGIMACLNKHAFYLQDTSQEFLIQLVETLKSRLGNMFAKFIDEQVRAIEDTKVKIKKRKGVIGFIKTFPPFAMSVENVFASIGREEYDRNADSMQDTRARVDEAYDRINRAMFDSLKVIAKESPTAASQAPRTGTDDPEDKEMLNYHVLIIENMSHYIAEVDDSSRQSVLTEWKGRAEADRKEAMDGYVGQVIRRPLGKLLEFLDSIDSMKASHPQNPASVTSRPTYSRKAARNLLGQTDGKELRRGIDSLRARIEKHFGHGDDEVKSRELVTLVCKECERAYERTLARIDDMIRELYPNAEGEKPVECGFSKADVHAGFGR